MAKKKYGEYCPQTQRFMTAVESFIRNKYGMKAEYEAQLILLATQFDLFIKAKEQIDKDGLIVQNRLGGMDKHPLLRLLTDCNIQCLKLIAEFGLSPKAVSKIKDAAEDATQDAIMELLSD